MVVLQKDVISIVEERDTIFFRNRVRELATKIGLELINQTKLITAASELVRNMLRYADGGKVSVQIVRELSKKGIRLIFEDKGPGISDLNQAMKEGYSSAGSLGLGLSGAKKLVDEFSIKSTVGIGTKVTIIAWKYGR